MKTAKTPYYKAFFIAAIAVAFAFFARGIYQKEASIAEAGTAIALDWNRFILRAETHTEGFRAPVAARAYGYAGLAAYEAALPALPGDYQSLGTLFPGLELIPPDTGKGFNGAISLNACYADILGKFFASAPQSIKNERTRLETKWEKILSGRADTAVAQLSKAYGKKIARAVFEWSATDSLGHLSNLHNYDRDYSPPKGEGKWASSSEVPMPAMLPYWGKVRPFVIQTSDYLARPLPEYSAEPHSPFYAQALEVLSLSSPLSLENQWIAEFWDGNHPGLAFTPAGHWLAIANQVVEKENPPVAKALETYLKVGFALADASVACWFSKFHYNLERPESFIQKNLAGYWRPHAPSPPFPAYPSGHSMMGAAAAEVLTQLYGSRYELTDKSHEGRQEFRSRPRHFHSFREMSLENSLSRILLGVHFRMDCEEGLRLGTLIGEAVGNVPVRKVGGQPPLQ